MKRLLSKYSDYYEDDDEPFSTTSQYRIKQLPTYRGNNDDKTGWFNFGANFSITGYLSFLVPFHILKPITHAIYSYGSVAKFSLKHIVVTYHIISIWVDIVILTIVSLCIRISSYVIRQRKRYMGTLRELYELYFEERLKYSTTYYEWLYNATCLESVRLAPKLLQVPVEDVEEWFHTHSLQCPLPLPKNVLSIPCEGLTISGWRLYPLEISGVFNCGESLRCINERLSALTSINEDEHNSDNLNNLIRNTDSMLESLTKRYGSLSEIIDAESSNDIITSESGSHSYVSEKDKFHVIIPSYSLSQIIQNLIHIIGEASDDTINPPNKDVLYGISYLGTHNDIETRDSNIVQLLALHLRLFSKYEQVVELGRSNFEKIYHDKNIFELKSQFSHLVLQEYLDTKRLLVSLQQSWGNVALALSGGGRLALAHIGVLSALHRAKCIPNIVSGASGGAVIASVYCTKSTEEFFAFFDNHKVISDLFSLLLPKPMRQLRNRISIGYNLDIILIAKELRRLLGDITFEEAYIRTGRVLCIPATPASHCRSIHNSKLIMSHVSTPNVLVWSAVLASCCLPILLPPCALLCKTKVRNRKVTIDKDVAVKERFNDDHSAVVVYPSKTPFSFEGDTSLAYDLLLWSNNETLINDSLSRGWSGLVSPTTEDSNSCVSEKDKDLSPYYTITRYGPMGSLWCDGSICEDIPTEYLTRVWGCREIITSQVNPHHAAFMDANPCRAIRYHYSGSWFYTSVYWIQKFFRIDLRQRYAKVTSTVITPNISGQDITEFFSQHVTGSINIVPVSKRDFHLMAIQPSIEEVKATYILGEQRTWPFLSRIRGLVESVNSLQLLVNWLDGVLLKL